MENNNKIRVADFVAFFLEKRGLNIISMVCAGSTAILNDAFYKNGKFQIIHSFRESNCAYHAIGYAKYTRKIGLINVSGGVCATIVAPQVLIAQQDKVPLLVISGSVALNQNIFYLKQKYNIKNKSYQGVQDGNNIDIFKSITNYCIQVQKAKDIRYELEKCLYYCQNNIPGPVFLEIPSDIQGEMVNPDELIDFSPPQSINDINETLELIKCNDLKELLNNSKRPIVLAGNGISISNTRKELSQFLEKYQLPLVTSFLGTDLIPYDSNYYIGTCGIKGSRQGNWSLSQSDLIIILGSSLPTAVVGYNHDLFAPKSKIIIVDINEDEHKIWENRINLRIKCNLINFFEYMLK